MPDYQIEMKIDGQEFKTLADILPETPPLKMPVVGKTPVAKSVESMLERSVDYGFNPKLEDTVVPEVTS